MATIGTLLNNFFTCKYVGQDDFGNQYFIKRFKDHEGTLRRSVIYNGIDESSKIPPKWHAWLHYNSDTIPSSIKLYTWQKEHKPNLTGTKHAYFPPGHYKSANSKRDKATGDYETWQLKK